MPSEYVAKKFDLSGLNGISDKTLQMHFKLYEGYVANTNTLNKKLAAYVQNGQVDQDQYVQYSELKRRLGFEYNGMVLHEYYFGNMKQGGGGNPDQNSAFAQAVTKSFGSFDNWRADFIGVGKMRGVGWAITYLDPTTGNVNNHWITLHEDGNVAGYKPLLVMDVWEHAFLLDYAPSERPKYIDAFFSNIDWNVVEQRMNQK